LIFISSVGRADEVVDIPSAHGMPTRVLISHTQAAKATVLLYIGGGGLLRIPEDGRINHIHTFVRSFRFWRDYEVQAVLIDSPIDLGNARLGHRRGSKDHLDRVSEVIRYFHSKSSRPIWIFGHSMGTVTAVQFANQSEKSGAVAGIIIAGTHIGETLGANFSKPVMAIHHKKEACAATPISASESIIKGRSKETKSELAMIDGGEDVGLACMGLSYHGFNKVEDQMVSAAAKFILEN
jgi:dienelactone hydrolase